MALSAVHCYAWCAWRCLMYTALFDVHALSGEKFVNVVGLPEKVISHCKWRVICKFAENIFFLGLLLLRATSE